MPATATQDDLLRRFIDGFTRAIGQEMDALKQDLGTFEVPLGAASPAPQTTDDERRLYNFAIAAPNDKLAVDLACTLRCGTRELQVTVTDLGPTQLQLASLEEVPMQAPFYTLVIYPWFLYERLLVVLDRLADDAGLFPEQALMLFGKRPVRRQQAALRLPHDQLNPSQRQAVELCLSSSLGFVWGPPGTGKTATLAHLLAELLAADQRVLVASTTNAAVDQALTQYAARPDAGPQIAAGKVLRLGLAAEPTPGTALDQVVAQMEGKTLRAIEALTLRRDAIGPQQRALAELLAALDTAGRDQLDLFGSPRTAVPSALLQRAFAPDSARGLAAWTPEALARHAARRQQRLARLERLVQQRLAGLRSRLRQSQRDAVVQARLLLTTLSGVTLNKLLEGQLFDAVICEEAGMAILPSLFYTAALSRQRVIMVGDPRQLPPIVRSRSAYARRAMGRDIFSIGTEGPDATAPTALLDIQYRMHPIIGDLVGGLFYEGRLQHGADPASTGAIAARAPFAGCALVVCDTAGTTQCRIGPNGQSRLNEASADRCLGLVTEALAAGLEDIGVITPYAEQARHLRQLLRHNGAPPAVECSTVHRFQGHEKDCIVFDATDADPLKPGVLLAGRDEAANLLNVSLSRARGKLLIVADAAYFARRTPDGLVSQILRQAAAGGRRVVWDAASGQFSGPA